MFGGRASTCATDYTTISFAGGDRGGNLGRDVQLVFRAFGVRARARVAGCAGTNSEQQSSNGRIDVS